MVASVVMLNSRVLRALDDDLQALALEFAGKYGGAHLRQPMLKAAETVIAPSIHQNFVSGGRPKKWEEVGTSAYRQLKGLEDTPPLWVTGKLQKAASRKARFRVKKNVLTYGYFPSALWFAGILDKGPDDNAFPARPFAMFQAKDIDDIIQIFIDWVEHKVNRHIKYLYS